MCGDIRASSVVRLSVMFPAYSTGNYTEVLRRFRANEPLRNVTLVEPSAFNYLTTTWEIEKYDFYKWRRLFGQYWSLSILISAIYVGLIFAGQRWMSKREPFKLKTFTILFNICMGIFCFTGFYRALPETLSVLTGPDGFYRSLCIL